MTKDEFLAWLQKNAARVVVKPYAVAPCHCGDINCHGWRLVPPEVVKTVLVYEGEELELV